MLPALVTHCRHLLEPLEGPFHDPPGTVNGFLGGRGQFRASNLQGPGQAPVGLHIRLPQMLQIFLEQTGPAQAFFPKQAGGPRVFRTFQFQADHFQEQGQRQGGPIGRGRPAAGIRLRLGQIFQKRGYQNIPQYKIGKVSAMPGLCPLRDVAGVAIMLFKQ